ncbi:hypothetical protein MTO96_006344 [Rhipicephalus appendiculatus]
MNAYAAYSESSAPVDALLQCLRGDPFDLGVAFGPEAFRLVSLAEAYESVAPYDRSLAGLEECSDTQLFFIALYYNRCEGGSSGNDESSFNVPLRHLRAFAKAFQCRPCTRMNLLLRCNFV